MRLKIVDGAMVWETSKTNPFLEYAKDQDALDSLMFMRLFSRRLHKVVSSSPHRGLHIAIQGNRTFRFQMSVNNELSVPSLAEDIERMNELASEYYKDMK